MKSVFLKFAALVAAIVGIYVAVVRLVEAIKGHDVLPSDQEAGH